MLVKRRNRSYLAHPEAIFNRKSLTGTIQRHIAFTRKHFKYFGKGIHLFKLNIQFNLNKCYSNGSNTTVLIYLCSFIVTAPRRFITSIN